MLDAVHFYSKLYNNLVIEAALSDGCMPSHNERHSWVWCFCYFAHQQKFLIFKTLHHAACWANGCKKKKKIALRRRREMTYGTTENGFTGMGSVSKWLTESVTKKLEYMHGRPMKQKTYFRRNMLYRNYFLAYGRRRGVTGNGFVGKEKVSNQWPTKGVTNTYVSLQLGYMVS